MKKFVLTLMVALMACVPWVTVIEAAEINHDQVVGFQEVTPVTVTQQAYQAFSTFSESLSWMRAFPRCGSTGQYQRWLEHFRVIEWKL